MEQSMNKLYINSIGIKRAVGFIGLVNLTYNLFRYEQVTRLDGIIMSNWQTQNMYIIDNELVNKKMIEITKN